MKSVAFDSREAWLNWRLGKITGSALKDVVNLRDGATKAGVYKAAAESLIGSAAIAEAEMTSTQAMARGHELEPLAIARFMKETGKKVDGSLVGWEHPDDPRIAVSPDGVIGKTAAIEVKCFLATKHVEALYTRGIPKNTGGYAEQLLQYFIVNEKLKTLYYVFYHPSFPAPLDYLCLTFTRKELAEEIEKYRALEVDAVGKVREIVNALSLYSPDDVAKINAVKEELLADVKADHRIALERVHAGIMERS